jgi:hypothetical protein
MLGQPMSFPITLTRRSLLRIGAAATATTTVGLRPWAPARAFARPDHLLRSSYAGRVGQRFAACSVQLELVSVADVAGAAAHRRLAGSEHAFVLTFAGPLGSELEGGTHTLSNMELGKFELFVSPVDQLRADRRYEAVIDRSVPAPRSRRAALTARRHR